MENFSDNKLTKIGVFYDGNYFAHVSNYYNYYHQRRQRLSVSGLHEFIRHKVAQEEGVDIRFCQIVDSHYFRGRLSASEAQTKNTLFNERAFDHVLMNEGVVTHYLPLGPSGEKGIDVWLALEAFELSIFKRFNVVVLIVCDGDYVPLVRKLNALGVRVMVLGWDFKVSIDGEERTTVTSQKLLKEVTYPTMMHLVIDDKTKTRDPIINNLFVPQKEIKRIEATDRSPSPQVEQPSQRVSGVIKALKRKRSISSIIVRSRAFRHRIGVEQIPENRECQMERKGIRLTGNLIWSRSPAKGSAPRLTPNVRVLPSPACIIGADV